MIRDILVSILRQLLATVLGGVIGWMTSHQIATSAEITLLLGVGAATLVNLAWAIGERLTKRWGLEMAFHLTPEEGTVGLKTLANETPLKEKLAVGISQVGK